MFCQKCGAEIPDGSDYCQNCGQISNSMGNKSPTKNDVPKCTCCGYVGPWKVDSLFRPMDWVIGIILLFLFGTGLIYLLVVGLIRSNKDNRTKICPKCGAKNLWTFLY